MAKSGYIKEVKYNLHVGAAGSPWELLGVIPPALENGSELALAAEWINTGDEAFLGHIGLAVTDPDGVATAVAATSGQSASVAAGEEGEVIFAAVTLSVDGIYAAEFTLIELDGSTIYDVETVQIATVSTTPEPDPTPTTFDINSVIQPLITVMIVGMMMKMMTGTMGE